MQNFVKIIYNLSNKWSRYLSRKHLQHLKLFMISKQSQIYVVITTDAPFRDKTRFFFKVYIHYFCSTGKLENNSQKIGCNERYLKSLDLRTPRRKTVVDDLLDERRNEFILCCSGKKNEWAGNSSGDITFFSGNTEKVLPSPYFITAPSIRGT